MGLSSSQARLLSLTSRMSDLEYSAQRISNSKMALARDSHAASDKYLKALDKETIKAYNQDTGTFVDATAANLTSYNGISPNTIQRFLKTSQGAVIVSEKIGEAYKSCNHSPEKFLNNLGYTTYTSSQAAMGGPLGKEKDSIIANSSDIINAIQNYETIKSSTQTSYDTEYKTAQDARIYASNSVSSMSHDSNNLEIMSPETATRFTSGVVFTDTDSSKKISTIDEYVTKVSQDNEAYYSMAVRAKAEADLMLVSIKTNGGTEEQIKTAEANAKIAADAQAEALELYTQAKEQIAISESRNKIFTDNPDYTNIVKGKIISDSKTAAQKAAYLVFQLEMKASSTVSAAKDNANMALPLATTKETEAKAKLGSVPSTITNAEAAAKATVQSNIPKIKASLTAISQSYPIENLQNALDSLDNTDLSSLKTQLTGLVSDLNGVENGTSTIISPSTYNPQYTTDVSAATYYTNLFKELEESGYSIQKDENMNSTDWLQTQLKNGTIFLAENVSKAGKDGKDDVVVVAWDTGDTEITAESDDRMLAKAKAEYEKETEEISEKDKRFDLKLKSIDTEHSATQTEMESLTKVMNKNIERTFKYFDA